MNLPQQHNTIPWLTLGSSTITVLLFLILGAAPESLVYSREAIANGEGWRLITGHFVHCDIDHLVWNVSGFLILGSLVEQRLGTRILSLTAICCLGVSGWLWFFNTDLLIYCGLSGALNGLLAVALGLLWSETKHPILAFIAVGSVAKIIIEATSHQSIFTDISWASVPDAHAVGLVIGLLYLGHKWIHTQTENSTLLTPR